jgi:hypothetical protein
MAHTDALGISLGDSMLLAGHGPHAEMQRDEQIAAAKAAGVTVDEEAVVAEVLGLYEKVIRSQVPNIYTLRMVEKQGDALIPDDDAHLLAGFSAFSALGSFTHVTPDTAIVGLMQYVDSITLDTNSPVGMLFGLLNRIEGVLERADKRAASANNPSGSSTSTRTWADMSAEAQTFANQADSGEAITGSNPNAEDLDTPAPAGRGRHDKVQGGNVHPGGRSFA